MVRVGFIVPQCGDGDYTGSEKGRHAVEVVHSTAVVQPDLVFHFRLYDIEPKATDKSSASTTNHRPDGSDLHVARRSNGDTTSECGILDVDGVDLALVEHSGEDEGA